MLDKKEYDKQYYIKNRDKILEYKHEYQEILKHGKNYQRIMLKYRKDCLKKKRYKKQYRIKNRDKILLQKKQYKARVKGGGPLTINTIQLVYEDNIKQYGTLTCYLCLQPILFGQDSLEHRTPLSRGGTNEYNNLAIACQKCNSKKGTKTEEEYRYKKIGGAI